MTASSARKSSAFSGLRFPQVQALMKLLSTTSFANATFLRRKYQEQHTHFDETVHFLSRLGLVKKDKRSMKLTGDPVVPDLLKGTIVRRIMTTNTEYAADLRAYLQTFKMEQQGCISKASASRAISKAATRDFLMDTGAVKFHPGRGVHLLEEQYLDVYVQAGRTTRLSPKKQQQLIARRSEIGFRAEEKVVVHERRVVGKRLADQVIHTALDDAGAGYDILSLRDTKGGIQRLFIEVKAVPPQTHRFFWSENEVELARQLRDRYYLYLLPVKKGRFYLSQLTVIQNPATAVLQDKDEWEVQKNVLECRRKRDS